MKLLSCAIREDGTYSVSILKPNGMVETFDNCQFHELRFGHEGRDLELHLQSLGIRHADSFETLMTSAETSGPYCMKE